MKLLEQIMVKILTLHEEFALRKFDIRSIWAFYKCYNIAIAILGIEDKSVEHKNFLWRKILKAQIEGEFHLRAYTKIQRMLRKDFAVVMSALKEINKQNEELGYDSSNLWKTNALAVQYFEMEEV